MKKLPTKLSEIAEAMTMFDGLSQAGAYLKLETGEIVFTFDPDICGEEEEYPDIDERPDEFLSIEQVSSKEGFRMMEDFVDALKASEAKEVLSGALCRTRPFRKFKDSLHDFPELREAYFTHYEAATRRLAKVFLEANDIQLASPTNDNGLQ